MAGRPPAPPSLPPLAAAVPFPAAAAGPMAGRPPAHPLSFSLILPAAAAMGAGAAGAAAHLAAAGPHPPPPLVPALTAGSAAAGCAAAAALAAVRGQDAGAAAWPASAAQPARGPCGLEPCARRS